MSNEIPIRRLFSEPTSGDAVKYEVAVPANEADITLFIPTPLTPLEIAMGIPETIATEVIKRINGSSNPFPSPLARP